MRYAIATLEKEIYLLEKCLSDWDVKTQYAEARNARERMLKDLRDAIDKIRTPKTSEL